MIKSRNDRDREREREGPNLLGYKDTRDKALASYSSMRVKNTTTAEALKIWWGQFMFSLS